MNFHPLRNKPAIADTRGHNIEIATLIAIPLVTLGILLSGMIAVFHGLSIW